MHFSLSSLPAEVLSSITDRLLGKELTRLMRCGHRELRSRLLEQPGVRSFVQKAFDVPPSFSLFLWILQLPFLQSFSLSVIRPDLGLTNATELKLGALPSSLTEVRLDYALSFFALVCAPTLAIFPFDDREIKLGKSLLDLKDELKPAIEEVLKKPDFDPTSFLFHIGTVLPRLRTLTVHGDVNSSLISGQARSASTPAWISNFLQHLPSSLTNLDLDWIPAANLVDHLPMTVLHATSRALEQNMDADLSTLFGRLDSFRFASSVRDCRLEASQLRQTSPLLHFTGSISYDALLKLPRLLSLETMFCVMSRGDAFPSTLTSLTLPNPQQPLDLTSILLPPALTRLRVPKYSVQHEFAAKCLNCPSLIELAVLDASEVVLSHLPSSLRYLHCRGMSWSGLHLSPTLTSIPRNTARTEWSPYFAANIPNPRLNIIALVHFYPITHLPPTLTEIPLQMSIASVPLDRLPTHIQTLGESYPINTHRLELLPRHLTHLALNKHSSLNAAQFRLLPSTIRHLTGGIFLYDTDESVNEVMAHLVGRKASYLKIPEDFRRALFMPQFDDASKISPHDLRVRLMPHHLEHLADVVDTVTIDFEACMEVKKTLCAASRKNARQKDGDSSNVTSSSAPSSAADSISLATDSDEADPRTLLSRTVSTLRLWNCNNHFEAFFSNFRFSTNFTHLELLGNVVLQPKNAVPTSGDKGKEAGAPLVKVGKGGKKIIDASSSFAFQLLSLLPSSLKHILIQDIHVSHSCVPHLPSGLESLIIGSKDKLATFRAAFNKEEEKKKISDQP